MFWSGCGQNGTFSLKPVANIVAFENFSDFSPETRGYFSGYSVTSFLNISKDKTTEKLDEIIDSRFTSWGKNATWSTVNNHFNFVLLKNLKPSKQPKRMGSFNDPNTLLSPRPRTLLVICTQFPFRFTTTFRWITVIDQVSRIWD